MLRSRCAESAAAAPDRSSLRRVRLDRVRALFALFRARDGVVAPEAAALEQALLAAFTRDRELYSDILEASFAVDARGEHAYRFSYAFPGWRVDPAAAAQTAIACAAPFGEKVVMTTKRLLRAAATPAVQQPLIGLAWDRHGAPRHKLYLQFRVDAGRAAWALCERVLAWPGLADQLAHAELHMLGVDFTPAGLVGAKLYVLHAHMNVDLGEAAPRPLRNVLAIHRCEPPSTSPPLAPPLASEIDFALAENHLTWPALTATPRLVELLRGSSLGEHLVDHFRLEVRRVSLAIAASPKISVYYCLREVEEP